MGRRRWSVLYSLLLLGFVTATAHAQAGGPCIRAVDPGISALLRRGLAASPTFRGLYERLGQSDLIVHLERGPHPWRSTGFNQFVAEVAERRFVRITLNVDHLDDDAVALLGHELQHAVELAVEPDVDDLEDYERLYRRIGYRSCARDARCFDTVAAVTAGRVILRELRQARSLPATSLARSTPDDEADPSISDLMVGTKTSERSRMATKLNRMSLVKQTALR